MVCSGRVGVSFSLMIYYLTVTNRRIRTRMYGGVGGKARKGLPIPIQKVEKILIFILILNSDFCLLDS